MDFKQISINTRNWDDSAQDRDYWRAIGHGVIQDDVCSVKHEVFSLALDGKTVENKGKLKLILTEIFPSVQKHDI